MRYSKDEMLEKRIRALRAALLRIADGPALDVPPRIRNLARMALRADLGVGGVVTHGWLSRRPSLCGMGVERDAEGKRQWATGHRSVDLEHRNEVTCPICLEEIERMFDGTPLTELGPLATRIMNTLKDEGIGTIEYADSVSDFHWMITPNFGSKSLKELRGAIEQWRGRQRACVETMIGG